MTGETKTTQKGVQQLDAVVIRFAGDSGDGMQMTGSRFTSTAALVGNDLGTFPDFPAEIRAPAGSLAGVSAFQVQFSSRDIYTPGDSVDVLVAMNPAALKVHIGDLTPGGLIIANKATFTDRNLKMAGWKGNPLEDGSLSSYAVHQVDVDRLVKNALQGVAISSKTVERTRNMFALGLTYWLYGRPVEPTIQWLEKRFEKRPELAEANIRVLKAGYNFGDITELFPTSYRVGPAPLPPGKYRNITGNQAIGFAFLAAAQRAGIPLFFAGYPITPASEILQQLSGYRNFGVKTFQAEDEIASIGAALGAAFAGNLAATASSGPGIVLKGETIGLAVITELPLVIVDVQRAGPSTGMPTKTEQGDLFLALWGRNSEAPLPVIAPLTPGDCFYATYEACRVAIRYMTPVMILSDAFLANGSEPWIIPSASELAPINAVFAKPVGDDAVFHPYAREDTTLSRPWAIPGVPGLEHRIGGLEKENISGNVCYDPDNHHKMVALRAEKVSRVAQEFPPTPILGDPKGQLLVLGWGSTFGAIRSAIEQAREEGLFVSHVQLRWVHPLPRDLGSIISRFRKILVPEINSGQFLQILRSKYLVDAKGLNVMRGKPFQTAQILSGIRSALRGHDA